MSTVTSKVAYFVQKAFTFFLRVFTSVYDIKRNERLNLLYILVYLLYNKSIKCNAVRAVSFCLNDFMNIMNFENKTFASFPAISAFHFALIIGTRNESEKDNAENEDDSEDMIGGLFAVRSHENELEQMNKSVLHQRDCSRDAAPVTFTSGDDAEMLAESIRDCFVTGKWTDSNAALEEDGVFRLL